MLEHRRGEERLGDAECVDESARVWAQLLAEVIDPTTDRLGTLDRYVPMHQEPGQVGFERRVHEQVADLAEQLRRRPRITLVDGLDERLEDQALGVGGRCLEQVVLRVVEDGERVVGVGGLAQPLRAGASQVVLTIAEQADLRAAVGQL